MPGFNCTQGLNFLLVFWQDILKQPSWQSLHVVERSNNFVCFIDSLFHDARFDIHESFKTGKFSRKLHKIKESHHNRSPYASFNA